MNLPTARVLRIALKSQDGEHFCYTAAWDHNRHTHGTGCTLASALASQLALGHSVADAMTAAGFALGSGIGATGHLWRLREHLADPD